MLKNSQFWGVFENLKFEVKQCYQKGQSWKIQFWHFEFTKNAKKWSDLAIFENLRLKVKQSHLLLRARFTFWVDKSSWKMPKIVNFGEFLKTRNLRTNSVTRHVKNAKIRKFKCNIMSGQKLVKMAKMVHFGEFFENQKLVVKQCNQTG